MGGSLAAGAWLDACRPDCCGRADRVERNIANVLPRPLLGGLITLNAGSNGWFTGLHRLRQNWEALSNGGINGC